MNSDKTNSALKWAFFVVAALDLIGVGLKVQWLEILSKPLITITLMGLYWSSSTKRNPLYLAALFFSLLGDLFLLDKAGFFLMGVGAFLITQLLYVVFVRMRLGKSTSLAAIKAALPFAVYLFVLMSLLAPELGTLFVPVLIYGVVISVFGMSALQNYLVKKDGESRILLLGALLFIGSDSMIAINKFHAPHMIYPVAIMLTYALAQYYIYLYVISTEEGSNP